MWPIVFPALSWEIFRIVPCVSVTSQLNKTCAVCLMLVCLCVSLLNFRAGLDAPIHAYIHTHTHSHTNTHAEIEERAHSRKWQITKFLASNVQIQSERVTVKSSAISQFRSQALCCILWSYDSVFPLTPFYEQAGQKEISSRERSHPGTVSQSNIQVWLKLITILPALIHTTAMSYIDVLHINYLNKIPTWIQLKIAIENLWPHYRKISWLLALSQLRQNPVVLTQKQFQNHSPVLSNLRPRFFSI